ncbi:hypothetical protein BAUCODRAFT_155971 [Baudoinia panamericana UAMH 10762]|uniref:Uncharacterized protein n=1 Tax=Baudoinia panamericana (strain UAMH 10762) TaxID=717646 RepID=M2MZY8_BAUPA|nr:uncharacterized protein BAUCODRAFT_155971 [Baudoinia panamericana UAMH 10762]EMC97213.1 hypothetical protein BAUCODRAFT_155971 [Baudoinia panamericana UAMH 10762]
MDTDVLRMMADLGIERRDMVSAPADDGRGRITQVDLLTKQAAIRDFEGRRNTSSKAKGPTGEVAAKLQAWNMASAFERDDVTEQLENRFSGQGHRAELAQAVRYGLIQDPTWEEVEDNHGEERALYLKEREAKGPRPNYGTPIYVITPSPKPNNFPTGPAVDRTPRSLPPKFATPGSVNRGRLTIRGPPSTNRAPSPRSQGTIRFTKGGNRLRQPMSGSWPDSARDPPTELVTSQLPSSTMTTIRGPSIIAPNDAANITTTTNEAAITSVDNFHTQQPIRLIAEWYAANPGQECDKYYADHPEQQDLYRKSYRELIKKSFRLAANPDSRETKAELETHKDQVWMFDEACTARDMWENGRMTEFNNYYAVNPHLIDFAKCAEKNLKGQITICFAAPQPARQVQVPTTPGVPSAANAPSKAGAPPTPCQSPPHPSPMGLSAHSASLPPIDTEHTTHSTAPTQPVLHPVTTTDTPSTLSLHNSATSEHQDIMGLPIPSMNDFSPYNTVATPTASASFNGASTSAAATSPPTSDGKGMLSVVYRNIAGRFLGERSWEIDAPVRLELSATTTSNGYDPRELMEKIVALGKALQGVHQARPTVVDRAGNMVLMSDGLWEEAHEVGL